MQLLFIEFREKRRSEYGTKSEGKVSEFSFKMVMLFMGMNEGLAVLQEIQTIMDYVFSNLL